MIALRGATTISCNCEEEIKRCSVELFDQLIKRNNLELDKILTIEFSCTRDITQSYPGKFIRENFDVKHAAIMHFNEMYVEDNVEASIPLCIRILILADTNQQNREFVYLNNARNLRKDLFSE